MEIYANSSFKILFSEMKMEQLNSEDVSVHSAGEVLAVLAYGYY
jgi:hypothetical protein